MKNNAIYSLLINSFIGKKLLIFLVTTAAATNGSLGQYVKANFISYFIFSYAKKTF
jgi:hypothetical protein